MSRQMTQNYGNEFTKVTNDSQNEAFSEDDDLINKAREELNENPDHRDQDIRRLREMVTAEIDLQSPTNDAFLLRLLRARKFNIDEAFKLLQNYYTIRDKYPELFANYRPSSVKNALNEKMHLFLPYRDQDGRSILVVRAGQWDPAKSTPDDSMVVIHMCVDHALRDERTQINGLVVVFDMKNFGFTQGRHGTPSNTRKTAAIFQDCLPARFKGFHFIYEPAIFYLCFLVIKPFLKEKTRSRVHFHGDNTESLHQHIHPEYLPKEYGGCKPSVDEAAELQMQLLLDHDDEIADFITTTGFKRSVK